MRQQETKVYVACLASYNDGRLFGQWIDVPDDADELRESIKEMLAKSPTPGAEEWAIHDYDGLPSTLGEWPDLEELCKIAAGVREHGPIFCELISTIGGDADQASEYMTENYCGAWESMRHYAESYIDDSGMLRDVPNNVSAYFDYEAFARDLENEMLTIRLNGETHVFHNN